MANHTYQDNLCTRCGNTAGFGSPECLVKVVVVDEQEYFIAAAKAMGRADGQSDKRNNYTPEHSHSAYRFRDVEGGVEAQRTYNEFYQTWRNR